MSNPIHLIMRSRLLAAILVFAVLASPRISDAQSYPPAWSASGHYAVGDLVQTGGNVYRAIKAVTGGENPTTSYTYWQLNQVLSNTTLLIGTSQTFPDMLTAWTYALNCRVADGVYLHFFISSAHGTLFDQLTAPLLLDHASGARMAILSDSQDNTFLFVNCSGIIVDTGHSFNTISGVTMEYSSGTTNQAVGIKADYDASISSVTNTKIDFFGTCVLAEQSGTITLSNTVNLSNFFYYGCNANSLGSIVCPQGLVLTGPANSGSTIGLYTSTEGAILADGSTITGCGTGVEAGYDGFIDFENSSVSGAIKACLVTDRGFVDCFSSNFTGNLQDLTANNGGFIDASNATFNSETSGGASDGSYIIT